MKKKKSPSIKEILNSIRTTDSHKKIRSESVQKGSKPNHPLRRLSLIIFVILFAYVTGFTILSESSAHVEDRVTINYPYMTFQELTSNLKVEDDCKQKRLMRLTMDFKLTSKRDLKTIKHKLPEILDSYYLISRDIRVSDLKGSEGVKYFKNKLLIEFNKIAHPAAIQDILIQELLIQ